MPPGGPVEPKRMIMAQRLDGQVRRAREVTNGERGSHSGACALSPYRRVNPAQGYLTLLQR
jgi:hypothetical protein